MLWMSEIMKHLSVCSLYHLTWWPLIHYFHNDKITLGFMAEQLSIKYIYKVTVGGFYFYSVCCSEYSGTVTHWLIHNHCLFLKRQLFYLGRSLYLQLTSHGSSLSVIYHNLYKLAFSHPWKKYGHCFSYFSNTVIKHRPYNLWNEGFIWLLIQKDKSLSCG